ncbi:PEP/pyruvate-binding domain-containing protein [Bacillus sp. NPDC077027]|uniref:PEP/pyruvate-binding domain-containing protein n=1 Tax=Bacillus sp. NPDC077027 TaxID=3390548 RepID=UPI003CFEC06D
MYSVLFSEAEESATLAGAKGVNLIKLNNSGLPVPDGFIITTSSFANFLTYNELHPNEENLVQKIKEGQFPQQMQEELLASLRTLIESYPSVAVRSSSVAEDLEGASFAGQYETYLNIKTDEEFLLRVKECWSSYFAARVNHYKEKMTEFEDSPPLMAVVVQGLIHSDVSGVIFSQHPVSGNTNQIMITASYGLGEAIVSGMVTPDTFIIDKHNFTIEKKLGTKEIQMVPHEEGVLKQPISTTLANQYCLHDEKLLEIAEITKQTEELYGHGIDLEFGISDGEFYLLQARPITSIGKHTGNDTRDFHLRPEELQDFWISMDDHMPGPTSPLFSSFIIPALKIGMRRNAEKYKVADLNIRNIKLYSGHIFASPAHNEMETANESVIDPSIIETLPLISERMYQILEKNFFPFYKSLDEKINQPLSVEEAIKGFEELKAFYIQAYDDHFDIVVPQMILSAVLEDMLLTYTGDPKVIMKLHEMLIGKMNKSLETDKELDYLSQEARQDTELLFAFTNSQSNEELLSTLRQSDRGIAFLVKLQEFLNTFGWRSVRSHDFIEETWFENPTFVLDIIKNNIQHNSNFDKEFERAVEKRKEIYQQMISSIEDDQFKSKFDELYQFALRAANVRDDHHFYIDAMLDAKARLYLLKIGEILNQKQAINNKEDIWYLYDDEVQNALTTSTKYQSIVDLRKEEMAENELIQPPTYTGSPTEEQMQQVEKMLGSLEEHENNTDDVIYGVGSSSGIVSGQVKVIQSADEFSEFKKDDILVCKTTTPIWTSLFRDAKAVITDAGSILSHSAIIAREYMIPAVLGTRVATSKLQTGDIVTVDGTNGRIQIMERYPLTE